MLCSVLQFRLDNREKISPKSSCMHFIRGHEAVVQYWTAVILKKIENFFYSQFLLTLVLLGTNFVIDFR